MTKLGSPFASDRIIVIRCGFANKPVFQQVSKMWLIDVHNMAEGPARAHASAPLLEW